MVTNATIPGKVTAPATRLAASQIPVIETPEKIVPAIESVEAPKVVENAEAPKPRRGRPKKDAEV